MAATNTAADTTTRPSTSATPTAPRGRCRVAVRGLAASIVRSTSRLKAMAAVRAATMQRRIPAAGRSQPNGPDASPGSMPRRAASRAALTANGSANTVWLNRTSSR